MGNPYDGHTRAAPMKQVKSMIGKRVGEVDLDMGYCGHQSTGRATVHADRRRRCRTPRTLWGWMKRHAAVEPSIGDLKTEHRLERNRLKGVADNATNAVLAAAAMNFHKLLGAFWRTIAAPPAGPLGAISAHPGSYRPTDVMRGVTTMTFSGSANDQPGNVDIGMEVKAT
jgi:hypothetical protein